MQITKTTSTDEIDSAKKELKSLNLTLNGLLILKKKADYDYDCAKRQGRFFSMEEVRQIDLEYKIAYIEENIGLLEERIEELENREGGK